VSTSADPAGTGVRARLELGMGLMALAMMIVPGIDAIAKLLSATVAPGQVAWGRFVFQTLLLLPLMVAMQRPLGTRQPGIHAARGALLAMAVGLLFWSLQYLPIANAIAIFFVEPLILTLFSAFFLGEPIGRRRLAAVCVGLAGALVVIRPNWAAFGWASVLPLGTAICFAGYLTLTRHAAADEDPLVMQLWAGVFAALVLSIALAAGAGGGIPVLAAAWPGLGAWGLFLAMGLLSAIGHVLIGHAFRLAPAGILAPFQYLEILSATVVGLLVFGDFPDPVTWLGTGIIVGAGLYVFLLERRPAG
jgi:drug/metabolite transporter (DMT)-like permease